MNMHPDKAAQSLNEYAQHVYRTVSNAEQQFVDALEVTQGDGYPGCQMYNVSDGMAAIKTELMRRIKKALQTKNATLTGMPAPDRGCTATSVAETIAYIERTVRRALDLMDTDVSDAVAYQYLIDCSNEMGVAVSLLGTRIAPYWTDAFPFETSVSYTSEEDGSLYWLKLVAEPGYFTSNLGGTDAWRVLKAGDRVEYRGEEAEVKSVSGNGDSVTLYIEIEEMKEDESPVFEDIDSFSMRKVFNS